MGCSVYGVGRNNCFALVFFLSGVECWYVVVFAVLPRVIGREAGGPEEEQQLRQRRYRLGHDARDVDFDHWVGDLSPRDFFTRLSWALVSCAGVVCGVE